MTFLQIENIITTEIKIKTKINRNYQRVLESEQKSQISERR